MNKMNKTIVGLLVVALALGGYAAFLKDSKTVVVENGKPVELGGFSPYIPVPEVNLGGLRLVGKKISLQTGSSTVCAIQSPSATSTLITAGVDFTLASTSAVLVDIAKGTNQYATTTKINLAYSVAASAQATIVASTTGSAAAEAAIFAPSTWFVVKYSDSNNGTGNASTGSCWATWAVTKY